MKKIYLIDGYSFLYRAYHVMPPLTNPQGIPINAVYGFTNMLLKLLQAHKPEYGIVAYDHHSPTLRKQAYADYKGGRTRREDLIPQFDLARDASRALGFAGLEAPGYEADDIIATLTLGALRHGMEVIIVSSDKDFMQLINGNVKMFDPMKEAFVGDAEVRNKFGVPPLRVRDVLALAGDASDNVPGVPGIGVKKAARLINDYGDLEGVLKNAGEITQPQLRYNLERFADQARLSYKLIGLHFDAPINLQVEDLKVLYHREQARDFCATHDFKSLLARI